jgi:hypothetical protein
MTPIHDEAEKYGLENSQFEWSHKTMNAVQAADWVDYLHRNIKNSVWLPQNDFDFPSLFNLLSRGWNVQQIKDMLRAFNEKVGRKLQQQHQPGEDKAYLDEEMLLATNFAF